jgi:hypothetical protein
MGMFTDESCPLPHACSVLLLLLLLLLLVAQHAIKLQYTREQIFKKT